jgi:Protein of unknown function (DUF2167)
MRRLTLASLSVLTVCLTLAAPAHADTSTLKPVDFNGPLQLIRGDVTGQGVNSFYFSREDGCKIAREDWGWADCIGIDALTYFLVPGADTVLFEEPNSDGHVDMSDWNATDKNATIADIEASLAEGLQAQGEKLGIPIVFKGWRVYPTLNAEQRYMYYATDSLWDGRPNINIKATVFDRQGYVPISIIPTSENPTEAEIRTLVEATLAQYHAAQGQDYASFVPGDAISGAGALGVLAALVGVKAGKLALGGGIAALLLLLKKVGVLVFVPIIWVANKLKGRKARATTAQIPDQDNDPDTPT